VRRTVRLLDLRAPLLLLSRVVATTVNNAILRQVSSTIKRRMRLISLTASVAIFLLSTSCPLVTLKLPAHGGVLVLLHEGATRLPSFCLWILQRRFHMQLRMNGRQLLIVHQLCARANSIPSPIAAMSLALVRSVVAHHGIRGPSASYRQVMPELFSITSERNQHSYRTLPHSPQLTYHTRM
jgi:hypothetical protein